MSARSHKCEYINNNNNNKIFYTLEKKESWSQWAFKTPLQIKTNDKTKVYKQFIWKKTVHKKNKTDKLEYRMQY